jgi:hypothetical protein
MRNEQSDWERDRISSVVLDSFAAARAATHIWVMCPHEQRDRPPPPGSESERGIKRKQRLLASRQKTCSKNTR